MILAYIFLKQSLFKLLSGYITKKEMNLNVNSK